MNEPKPNLERFIALIEASAHLMKDFDDKLAEIRPIVAELKHNIKATQATIEADTCSIPKTSPCPLRSVSH